MFKRSNDLEITSRKMSDIIEKTIASLPGLIAGAAGIGGDKSVAASRAFQTFVNSLGAIHSKYVSIDKMFLYPV